MQLRQEFIQYRWHGDQGGDPIPLYGVQQEFGGRGRKQDRAGAKAQRIEQVGREPIDERYARGRAHRFIRGDRQRITPAVARREQVAMEMRNRLRRTGGTGTEDDGGDIVRGSVGPRPARRLARGECVQLGVGAALAQVGKALD